MFDREKSVEIIEIEKQCKDELISALFTDINVEIEMGIGYIKRLSGRIDAKKDGKQHRIEFGDISLKEFPISVISIICMNLTKSLSEKDLKHGEGYINKVVYQFKCAGFTNIKSGYTYGAKMPKFFSIQFGYEGAMISAKYYIEDLGVYEEECIEETTARKKLQDARSDITIKNNISVPSSEKGRTTYYSPYDGINDYQEYKEYDAGIRYDFSTEPISVMIQKETNCVLSGFKCDFGGEYFYRDAKLYYKGSSIAVDDGAGCVSISLGLPLQHLEKEICSHAGKQAIKFEDNYFFFENEIDKNTFLRYIDEHNQFVDNMYESLFNRCEAYYHHLWSRPEIPDATQNFLDMFPEVWFNDVNIYSILLCKFSWSSRIIDYKLQLDKNIQERSRVILKDSNNANAFNDAWTLILNFANLLEENYEVNAELSEVVVYMLMNKGLIKRYSNIWKEDYNSNLDVIDSEAYVNNCVTDYCCLSNSDEKGITALTYALLENDSEEITGFIKRYYAVKDLVENAQQKQNANNFAKMIFKDRRIALSAPKLSITDVDLMSGAEFEQLICDLFSKMKYKAYVTKTSGDQGIDVIAEKDGIKVGVQTKCYSGTVGNSAVQEAAAGKLFYNCNRVLVVTNNYFTKSAVELAKVNGIVLWDRDKVIELIQSVMCAE